MSNNSADIEARVTARFANSQPISVGRIVHFVLRDGKTIRPALVVRVWGNAVNLRVYYDGSNDDLARGGPEYIGQMVQLDNMSADITKVMTEKNNSMTEWVTSGTYDGGETREAETVYNPLSWHWPTR